DDEIAWWIDLGATCHACKDRCWFDTFHPVEDGSVLHMGDKSIKPILGHENVVTEFVWGCRAVVRLPEPKKKNLGENGIDCVFIGYVEHSKAYRFYVIEPNDSVSVNSDIKSRDAIFDENLQYLDQRTPDIAFAVGKLSRFTSNPSNHHWEVIVRVFRYLKKIMNYGLSYVGFPSVIKGGGAISWASKKQTYITDSMMESKFVALADVGKEAEWLRNLIYEIPLWPKPISPISMHCDSATTLAKAYSQIYNGRFRHLGARLKEVPMRAWSVAASRS
ncbi:hypothetical protein Tco_1251081, partial [Tanacetum coccineum]